MKLFIRILLPILILGACGYGTHYFVKNKQKPRKMTPPPQVTKVEGKTVVPGNYQMYLDTRGTVRPRTTTALFPEVSGRIISISPHFREGGFFEQGEVLLSVEKLRYQNDLVVANSQLAQARTTIAEEEARANQAAENWKRLGKRGTPSPMVLRQPQLNEAHARMHAAEADVEKAVRDLARTDIRAPYAGRILEQRCDVGQFVTPNTQLGRSFATDFMEVRLPLSNEQLGFVDLPETFRDDQHQIAGPEVTITAKFGSKMSSWKGEVVRVDSAIDESTRQLFVVAQIEDPYRKDKAGEAPLKIGMFVDAVITGRKLKNVFVLPRSTVRVSGEVILIDKDMKIQRQKVEPIFKAKDEVVFAAGGGGIKDGDVLCLTPLAYPVNGTPVLATIDGVAPKLENFPASGSKGKGKGKGKGKAGKGRADKGGSSS